MSITLGILAHVDHGKTTLSEQILYTAGVLRAAGRVDGKNTLLDHNEVERQRGITVFADQASFQYGEKNFNLLDTPGHVDFAGEMERAAFALDCAVLVISGVEGVQSHTNTIWQILKRMEIPTFIFINKTDRPGADIHGVIDQVKAKWGVSAIDFSHGFSNGNFSQDLQEEICGLDDELLEFFLEKGYEKSRWIKAAGELIAGQKLLAVFCGSALSGTGVRELMEGMAQLVTDQGESKNSHPLAARVYKVGHDKQKNRVTYLKITGGTLHAKDTLDVGGMEEKVNEIRRYNGEKSTVIPAAYTGDIVGVTGLSQLMPGDVVGEEKPLVPSLVPLMKADVNIGDLPPQVALEYLREIESEEPLLGVKWNEEVKTISVDVAGKIQLEVLEKIFSQRFGAPISFSDCKILYKETLTAPSYGCGHFEPLRHYAEVHLLLTPTQRGSGITYSSDLSLDILGQNWQNAVKTHVFEKQHLGVLTGSPVTDLHITLKNGRAHIKHTDGGDFRQSTYRAIRYALITGSSELLEPFYNFTMTANMSYTGRMISDIERLWGSFEPPMVNGENTTICGSAPVATMMGYVRDFIALTKGEGQLFLEFGGYRSCHNSEEVIADIGYDPQGDKTNTADSVFCAKGAGYNVPWVNAREAMQLEILDN
ncbi:MAG: TetM/TetW/TetO/TetS family tetracycline resistance ribosomal protection protein [Oscillospiraceae bacterium]